MKYCKYCHSEMDKKAKICLKCGKSQSNKMLKLFIIFVVTIIVIVGCSSIFLKGVDDAIEEVTNDKTNLKLEENTVTSYKDEYGFSQYIEGYITNNSNKAFSYVQVTFTTYDKEGNTLGTCIDNNSGLDVNGRWKFKAICVDSVSEISSYKLSDINGW